MTDYIEVRGPGSLAELVSAKDADTAPSDEADAVLIDLGGDEWAQVQYDEVDALSWPYMITVESRTDDDRRFGRNQLDGSIYSKVVAGHCS